MYNIYVYTIVHNHDKKYADINMETFLVVATSATNMVLIISIEIYVLEIYLKNK